MKTKAAGCRRGICSAFGDDRRIGRRHPDDKGVDTADRGDEAGAAVCSNRGGEAAGAVGSPGDGGDDEAPEVGSDLPEAEDNRSRRNRRDRRRKTSLEDLHRRTFYGDDDDGRSHICTASFSRSSRAR